MARKLTEAQVEESLRFGMGALAAAGHVVTSSEVADDIRALLQEKITMGEYEERAYRRAMAV